MFYRKIIDELRKWSNLDDRKPLILRGARQVGKTTAIDIFSKDFDQYMYLNLEKKEDAALFERKLPIDDLVQAIFLSKNLLRSGGRTLLFIDEIQFSSQAVSSMRYFYESIKDLYVIAAGSMLEMMSDDGTGAFPVGRVQYLFMYPLTFEEFLIAVGETAALEMYHQIPMPDFAHSKLLTLFHKYVLIGGMPEVVQKYSEQQDLVLMKTVYQGLLTAYMDDAGKYARNSNEAKIIRHAIESAPLEAGRRIKFQGFGSSNYRSREMSEALKTLERAMLIYLFYPSTATEPPVRPDLKKSPKLQFLDTGLINFFMGLQDYFFQMDDLHSFYQGILAEHIVGQELLAKEMSSRNKLAFWVREKKQSNAEVDFIIPMGKYVIPCEVKKGKSGTLRSLHQFVNRSNHPFAVRLYAGELRRVDTETPEGKKFILLNLPYFLAGKLPEYISRLVDE